MARYEDEAEMFFESIGGKRERGLNSESRASQSLERQPEQQSHQGDSNGHTQTKAADTQAWGAMLPPQRYQHSAGEPELIKSKREFPLQHHDEQPEQSGNNHVSRGRSLEVKEPTENEDLTKAEFERYQARYGLRHKTSASQILQGMSDQDAEDPTLGNRRTQIRLSEDGTIDRRDFDDRGAFRYDSTKGERRMGRDVD